MIEFNLIKSRNASWKQIGVSVVNGAGLAGKLRSFVEDPGVRLPLSDGLLPRAVSRSPQVDNPHFF